MPRHGRLIIMDDAPDGAAVMALLLVEHGFSNVWAISQVTEFLAMCGTTQPELVLLSLGTLERQRVKLGDFFQVLREACPDTAVIGLSAKEAERKAAEASSEFYGIICGPVRHEELVAVIGRALRHAAQVRVRSRQGRDFWRLAAAQSKQLAAYTFIDPVTGLLNRRGLQRSLESKLKDGAFLGVIFIVVDGLSELAQLHGYPLSERSLAAIGKRLSEHIPEGFELGLWGGNELLAIAFNLTSDQLHSLAGKLLERLGHEFVIDRTPVSLSGRAGVVLSRPGVSAERLVHQASLALLGDKALSVQHYSADLEEEQRHRLSLQVDIRHAAQRGELHVQYQPKVQLATGDVIGAEALLRWNHPTHGPVPPDQFIALAEESGDIVEIGEWVTRRVARQVALWDQSGQLPETFTVAINVAPQQVIRSDFAWRFEQLIQQEGASLARLAIEVTESGLMMELERAAEQLLILRKAGVEVAIDDFGKGESSLAYLKRLPVTTLKIDKEFIGDLTAIDDDAGWHLAGVVTRLAHGLGCSVVAEGVETVEQHSQLLEMGCEQGQGYLYSKALGPSEFIHWWEEYAEQNTSPQALV